MFFKKKIFLLLPSSSTDTVSLSTQLAQLFKLRNHNGQVQQSIFYQLPIVIISFLPSGALSLPKMVSLFETCFNKKIPIGTGVII